MSRNGFHEKQGGVVRLLSLNKYKKKGVLLLHQPSKSTSMHVAEIPLITILGPTASGKTRLAVALASVLGAEIISGDSRQVYRGMDIGTGKDISDYTFNGKAIPYHLIDILEAGLKYNVYEFQRDFLNAWNELSSRKVPAILCGGTGLYIESVLREYKLLPVPVDSEWRETLKDKTLDELTAMLSAYKKLHNTTDVDTVKRAIRAIEIEAYYELHDGAEIYFPKMKHVVFGLMLDRDERRSRITMRLKSRLEDGMIEEVECLLAKGIPTDDLIYYGLEYKFVTLHLTGALSYQDMFKQLEIAIHQFAKRQMTWFRGMETRGIHIHWLEATDPIEVNVEKMLEVISQAG
jgi:tRNA dimethylallyltransferase